MSVDVYSVCALLCVGRGLATSWCLVQGVLLAVYIGSRIWKNAKAQQRVIQTYLSSYLWLYSLLLGLGRFFRLLILCTVGRTPWTGDKPAARPLPTHGTTQTQNKCTHTSMPWLGFEPTIPVFQRAKRVHALDHAATVIGCRAIIQFNSIQFFIYLRAELNSRWPITGSARKTNTTNRTKHP
jgi:hypothetical protein